MKQQVRKGLTVSEETYNRLTEYGEFGESFDDVLNKLMDREPKIRSRTK
jgi:predicted CopG family antitoxin